MAIASGTVLFASFRCCVFCWMLTSGVVLPLCGAHQVAFLIRQLQWCHRLTDGYRERYGSIRFVSLLRVLLDADEWGCSSSVRCSSGGVSYSSVAVVPSLDGWLSRAVRFYSLRFVVACSVGC